MGQGRILERLALAGSTRAVQARGGGALLGEAIMFLARKLHEQTVCVDSHCSLWNSCLKGGPWRGTAYADIEFLLGEHWLREPQFGRGNLWEKPSDQSLVGS